MENIVLKNSNVTIKVKEVYHKCITEGKLETARRLLRKLINAPLGVKTLKICLHDNNDWVLAGMFDENHNGFYFNIR